MAKGTKVHSYPDLFLGDVKLSIVIVQYDDIFYSFEFRKNIETQLESKSTINKSRSLLECKRKCEARYDQNLKDGYSSPFGEIAIQAEQKQIINFLNKYG